MALKETADWPFYVSMVQVGDTFRKDCVEKYRYSCVPAYCANMSLIVVKTPIFFGDPRCFIEVAGQMFGFTARPKRLSVDGR